MKKTLIDTLGWTQGTFIFKMLFSPSFPQTPCLKTSISCPKNSYLPVICLQDRNPLKVLKDSKLILNDMCSLGHLPVQCLAAPAKTFSCAHSKITIIFFQHSRTLIVLKIGIITRGLCPPQCTENELTWPAVLSGN